MTQRARIALPLRPSELLALGGVQIKQLNKTAVQAILAQHGVRQVLAKEGGRTSLGSIKLMRDYVCFLNGLSKPVNLDAIEAFWVAQARRFPPGKPFKLRIDAGLSLRAAVRDLLAQARRRQADFAGSRHEGAMLQHLVGAKLELVLPPGSVSHHSASEADQAEGRAGDFLLGDVAIHVTTHPGEALIQKCAANLEAGLRPLIVTVPQQTAVADGLAETAGIAARVDILDVAQFLAANLHERSHFAAAGRHSRTEELVANYNRLIDEHETDPSLKIEIAR